LYITPIPSILLPKNRWVQSPALQSEFYGSKIRRSSGFCYFRIEIFKKHQLFPCK